MLCKGQLSSSQPSSWALGWAGSTVSAAERSWRRGRQGGRGDKGGRGDAGVTGLVGMTRVAGGVFKTPSCGVAGVAGVAGQQL